jgi:hypothetical protein
MFVLSIAPEKGEGKGGRGGMLICGKNITFDSREKQGKMREGQLPTT